MKLSIVATPIGNLEDITLRALRILTEAQVIYCEDTRVTKKLLDKYQIHTPLKRLDAHTETARVKELVDRLAEGQNIAYVTDAGTPGISDPGYRLVASVREVLEGVIIEAIPGPSALTAALSISGISADHFEFFGFLPHKKGRQTALTQIAEAASTVILYESPHRILKLLSELSKYAPQRKIALCREITKKFEEVQHGTPAQLHHILSEQLEHTKGEFVVIIEA